MCWLYQEEFQPPSSKLDFDFLRKKINLSKPSKDPATSAGECDAVRPLSGLKSDGGTRPWGECCDHQGHWMLCSVEDTSQGCTSAASLLDNGLAILSVMMLASTSITLLRRKETQLVEQNTWHRDHEHWSQGTHSVDLKFHLHAS